MGRLVSFLAAVSVGSVAAVGDRVAVIGAGIAGSSTAWFLRGEGLNVTVFEAQKVGGRVQEFSFPPESPIMLEAGGAAIHSLNQYMQRFMDELGLHKDSSDAFHRTLRGTLQGSDETIASWDGQTLETVKPLSDPLSLLRARSMVSSVTQKWERIYDLQAQNASFEHPRQLLEALGVSNLASTSARDWFKGKVSPHFLASFVDGVSRVNYGQDSSINAFAESISLAGAGLVGSLFGVKEGNAKVMEGLIQSSGARLRQARVTEVSASGSGYSVCVDASTDSSAGSACEDFDSVVIAAPLELAKIDLKDMQPPEPAREYQETVATFVAAAGLDGTFFGTSGVVAADTVMTQAKESIPFNSVSVHGHSKGQKVYKLFSRHPPATEMLNRLFVNVSSVSEPFDWRAYPVLHPRDRWPAFRLHRGPSGSLLYANAMESPVSCMETEAVGAKNVALLLLRDRAAARIESSTLVV